MLNSREAIKEAFIKYSEQFSHRQAGGTEKAMNMPDGQSCQFGYNTINNYKRMSIPLYFFIMSIVKHRNLGQQS